MQVIHVDSLLPSMVCETEGFIRCCLLRERESDKSEKDFALI